MSRGWLRFSAVLALSLLCAGLIGFLWLALLKDGNAAVTKTEAGWLTATFLAIREFISKIEAVVNGHRADAPGEEAAA